MLVAFFVPAASAQTINKASYLSGGFGWPESLSLGYKNLTDKNGHTWGFDLGIYDYNTYTFTGNYFYMFSDAANSAYKARYVRVGLGSMISGGQHSAASGTIEGVMPVIQYGRDYYMSTNFGVSLAAGFSALYLMDGDNNSNASFEGLQTAYSFKVFYVMEL